MGLHGFVFARHRAWYVPLCGGAGFRSAEAFREQLLSTIWVWVAVEICSIALGLVAWVTQRPIFPEDLYPTFERGLLTTQTIQLTAYLTGAIFSVILIIWTWHRRSRLPALAATA